MNSTLFKYWTAYFFHGENKKWFTLANARVTMCFLSNKRVEKPQGWLVLDEGHWGNVLFFSFCQIYFSVSWTFQHTHTKRPKVSSPVLSLWNSQGRKLCRAYISPFDFQYQGSEDFWPTIERWKIVFFENRWLPCRIEKGTWESALFCLRKKH